MGRQIVVKQHNKKVSIKKNGVTIGHKVVRVTQHASHARTKKT